MADLERVKLDQIPEIKHGIADLQRQRDGLNLRLINGVDSWDEYLKVSGEIRGINRTVRAVYAPRELT